MRSPCSRGSCLLGSPRLVAADRRQLAQVVAVPVDSGVAPVELEDVRAGIEQLEDLGQAKGLFSWALSASGPAAARGAGMAWKASGAGRAAEATPPEGPEQAANQGLVPP